MNSTAATQPLSTRDYTPVHALEHVRAYDHYDVLCNDVLYVFAMITASAFPLVCIPLTVLSWRHNRLDLREDCKRFYRIQSVLCASKNLWLPERWIFLEIPKVALLLAAIFGVFGAVSEYLVRLVWCGYDASVLVHCFAMLASRCKVEMTHTSRGTVWYTLLYTMTAGLGYGTTLKFSFDKNVENSMKMGTIIFGVLVFPVIIVATLRSPRYTRFRQIFERVVAMVVASTSPLLLFIIPACPSRLLFQFTSSSLLVCGLILGEGSVFRNLPELVHILSAVVCLCIYHSVARDTYFSKTIYDTSQPITQLIVVTLVLNFLVAVTYDVVFYCDISCIQQSLFTRFHLCSYFKRPAVLDAKGNALECPICFGKIRESSNIVMLDVCGHHFHKRCLMHSFKSFGGNCPLCRTTFSEVNIRKLESPRILSGSFRSRWRRVRGETGGRDLELDEPSSVPAPLPTISQLFHAAADPEEVTVQTDHSTETGSSRN